MRVLGLDLSLVSSGWCVLEDGKVEDMGVIQPKTKGGARLNEINLGVQDHLGIFGIHGRPRVDLVAAEDYAFAQHSRSVTGLAEVRGVIRHKLWCEEIPFVEIPSSQWRKSLFGKNVKKEMVRLLMHQKFGLEHPSLDALEAFGVGLCAYRMAQEDTADALPGLVA